MEAMLMNTSSFPITARPCWTRVLAPVVTATAIVVATSGPADAAPAPAVGDTYDYRVFNGYNKEVRGQISYRVDQTDADRITVSVATDIAALGPARTEIYTQEGNWLRHPVTNHDQPVEYEFAPAYPAYVLPLATGKSWSVRVNAVNPATGRRNSVRVDGEVLGAERITVPAGAFDTIKVRRRVYAGDWDGVRFETNITETDWYAPALGRAVRTESNSGYMDPGRCGDTMHACTPIRGDWNVIELTATSTGKP
jgi:hypothetical protein